MAIETKYERMSKADIENLFRKQKEYASKVSQSSFRERKDKLERMLEYLIRNASHIENATHADLKKTASETRLTEIVTLTSEIRYHLKNLKRWMRPQRVSTPMLAIGTQSYIQYEAKGTSLIISPWNYPVSLALKPLISAVSAGCTAIIKPSEFTPHSSAFVSTFVRNLFNPEEVAVVEGDRDVSSDLLSLPFDHIFFTGSPGVGKIVMKAASAHLSSVSLELGGKSPSIIDDSADIPVTARRIAWAKFLNNGQTCIAPDYVLIDQRIKDRFLAEMKVAVKELYQKEGTSIQSSPDYGRIIHHVHFDRIKTLFENAVQNGARVETGGVFDHEDLYIAPTILSEVNRDMTVMQEEIFGPILPVLAFQTLADAISMVNEMEKPLALYVHSRNKQNTDEILTKTSSGNALVNEILSQFQHSEIPFGGIGNSGMGKANGFFGFQEFSNPKGVIRRNFGTLKFIYPPFTETKDKIVNFLMKYI